MTLKRVGGALAFVAGAKIELGPVDPAAIAARAASPTDCRALRASYRALIAPSPCATNADCVGLQGVDIPGDPVTCQVETNPGSAATLAQVERAWSAACVVGPAVLRDSPPGGLRRRHLRGRVRRRQPAGLCAGLPPAGKPGRISLRTRWVLPQH